jgi:hypothetical protein
MPKPNRRRFVGLPALTFADLLGFTDLPVLRATIEILAVCRAGDQLFSSAPESY